MSLPTRKIGTAPVSAIGYGAMGLSGMYSKPMPDEERLKVCKIVLSLLFAFQDIPPSSFSTLSMQAAALSGTPQMCITIVRISSENGG
jgi:hypothetical protein